MEDTSTTPGNLRQERKCSTSLETKIAGFTRDEMPIGRMTSIKKCFSILLSNIRNKLSRIKLTFNLFLFLGYGSHLGPF